MTREQAMATLAELRCTMGDVVPPKPAPRPPVAGTAERWRRLHVMTYQRIRDPYAVLAAIYAAPIGFPGCGCDYHAVDWIGQRPPPVHDRAEFERWVVDWRNTIAAAKGRRQYSYAEAREANPPAFHLSSTGLGDAVCGLYVACGFAKATGQRVTYRAHSADWLNAVAEFPGVTIEPIARGRLGPDVNGGPDRYLQLITTAKSFSAAYADNLARAYDVPAFEPVRPLIKPITPVDGRPIVLAPLTVAARCRRYSGSEPALAAALCEGRPMPTLISDRLVSNGSCSFSLL